MTFNVAAVADLVGGRPVGDLGCPVTGCAGADQAGPGDLTFATDGRWLDVVRRSSAACVLVTEEVADLESAQVVVDDPNLAFARVVSHLLDETPPEPGIHPEASVHPDATIDPTAAVGARAVIDRGARVGARTLVSAGCYLGADVQVGEDCCIHPNVTVLEDCRIQDRVIVWSGTVIGGDGFGYATTPAGEHVKIPQTGIVVVEDDVEIGACVCIDRARIAETRIGAGTKIDNLVQVGHNVRTGDRCLIVSQAGIAGSTELGQNVVLGGKVGITGHVKIGDGAQVTAMSGVGKNLPGGAAYMGIPAIPFREGVKVRLLQTKLPEMFGRLKDLEARLSRLEESDEAAESGPGGAL